MCLGRMGITTIPSFPFQKDNHSVPVVMRNLYPFLSMKKLNTIPNMHGKSYLLEEMLIEMGKLA